jgi:putative secretion ATPase (PEP-CTERM system associated)
MYESFYKLSAKPFQLSPDPRFYYPSSGHKRAMAYLRYGLAQGEGFIVITGDIGSGKSMLVRTLLAELSNENVLAAQLVTTQLEAEDLLKMAAAALGLPDPAGVSKGVLLKQLETFLSAQAKAGKRVLLVIDEAQNLPPRSLEELRMLSNFQVGQKALLQSFLLGQREFRSTLLAEGLEQLRQRIIAAYHLSPLSLDETRSYIEHRLHLVGWNGMPSFSDAAFDSIYQLTGGIPRRVNLLCDRLLLYGFLEEKQDINKEAVKIVQEELLGELSYPKTEKPTAQVETPKAGTLAPVSDDVEHRIIVLEKNMKALENAVRRGFGLLRRAMLSNAR